MWKIGRVRCLSLFDYDEKIRSLLFQFKGAGDIELSPVFFSSALPLINLVFRSYVLVGAPSSKENDESRGFNQVKEMANLFSMKKAFVLRKTINQKQSSLSYKKRQEIQDFIVVSDKSLIKGKKVLLLDDVYTTGATAMACINALFQSGAKKVFLLVMAKTKKSA